MQNPFSLGDKTVLVTGGTRGIGRAIALGFARAGANVIANYVRDQKSADDLLATAQPENLRLKTVRADVSGDAGLKTLLETVAQDSSGIFCLVHCAASGVHRPIEQLTLRHFDFTYGLNVRAFFALVTGLLPNFTKGSSIIALSSEGAVRAVTQYTLVGSSKGALESLVRHFAAELAPKGIRVNCMAPGTVMTDAWKVLPDAEKRLDEAVQKTPLGRLVTLDEVALAAQFLCSDASTGMIGQTLVLDGGARIAS